MTKKQLRDETVLKHGLKLKHIFPNATLGPVSLYEALLRIEKRAHRLAERECSEDMPDGYVEKTEANILGDLDAILHYTESGSAPVILNGDPRGYALKIDSGYVKRHKLDIYTDWGGYGILAPEF